MTFTHYLKRLLPIRSASPSIKGSRTLNLEGLEERCTPATILFPGTTPGDDTLSVATLRLPFNGLSRVDMTSNGFTTTRLFAPGDTLLIQAGAGNDRITLFNTSPDLNIVIDGQAGADVLVAPNTANVWSITGTDVGKLNSRVAFRDVECLQGGSAQDRFLFVNAGKVRQIDGGGGYDQFEYSSYAQPAWMNLATREAAGVSDSFRNLEGMVGSTRADTLIGPNDRNVWNITAANRGNIDGQFHFSAVENLTGGTEKDLFVFSANVGVTGRIDGAAGHDQLEYWRWTRGVAVNLATQTADGLASFRNIEGAIGSSRADTLIGPNDRNVWNITATNAGNVDGQFIFSSFENLTGGTEQDLFVLSAHVGVTGRIDGGAGYDQLEYWPWTRPVTVNLATQTAPGLASFRNIEGAIGSGRGDTLIGPNDGNVWHITANNAGDVDGRFWFSYFDNLTGGSAQDYFVLTPGVSVAGLIDGAGGVDALDYSNYTTPVRANLFSGTVDGVAGRQATNTGGVRRMEMLLGGSGRDILIGDANANVLVGNGGDDRLHGMAGADVLIGGTGRDLIFGGNDGDALIAGWTNHDNDLAALASVLAEWSNPLAGYESKVQSLTDGRGFDLSAATVHDDGTPVDDLRGELGRDWYFLHVVLDQLENFDLLFSDVALNVAANEEVTRL